MTTSESDSYELSCVATISSTRDVVFVVFVSFLFLNLLTSNFSGHLFHKTYTLSFKTQRINLYSVMPMPEAKLAYANVFYCLSDAGSLI